MVLRTQFTTFEERRGVIKPTLEHLRLDPAMICLLGGGGLALHGIDTRWRVADTKSARRFFEAYDLDILVPRTDFIRLKEEHPARQVHPDLTYRWDIPARRGRPVVQALINNSWKQRTCMNLMSSPKEVYVDGCGTFSPDVLAKLKNSRGSARDAVGLILGQLQAFETGNPIADEHSWQTEIAKAVAQAETPGLVRRTITEVRTALPPQFNVLMDNHFDHPAFEQPLRLAAMASTITPILPAEFYEII